MVDSPLTGVQDGTLVTPLPQGLRVGAPPLVVPEPRPGLRARAGAAVIQLLNEVHRSQLHPAPVVVDGALLAAATRAVRLPLLAALVFVGTALLAGLLSGLYAEREQVLVRGVLWYPPRAVVPVALAGFVCLGAGVASDGRLLLAFPLGLGLLVVCRVYAWAALVTLRRRGHGLVPTLLVGRHADVALVWRRLLQFPEAGLLPVAVQTPDEALVPGGLAAAARRRHVGYVVLVPRSEDADAVPAALCGGDHVDAAFAMVPPIAELFLQPGKVGEVGGIPLVPLGWPLRQRTTFRGKRGLDLLLAVPLLLVTLPVLAVAALAVKLEDGGPVLFRQQRVGRHGRPFAMYKLRSMCVDADGRRAELRAQNATDGLLFKLHVDPRVTRVGRVIRRLSVDELPQLLNVIRGEMSMVGPRPLPVSPDDFGVVDGQRHLAPPGITGYWQVSGGNGLTYDEMVRLDLAYVRSWTLALDVKLLLRTVPALLHRHGPA